MRILLFSILLAPSFLWAQVTGSVTEEKTKQPVVGAKIFASDGNRTLSDYDGNFTLSSEKFPVTIVTIMPPYVNDTTVIQSAGEVKIYLAEVVQNISTVVVSASRRQQEVEEVPVSMEVIRPGLIDNKAITNITEAVDQTPGVFTMDGQVSIRGGSGFAYGAGSRVLVLWNGMPLLSGYAGDTQWNAIPMEQASQIEIMKGAASVLYGSGALNGVISLYEKEPTLEPETKFKVQWGVYDKPQRESLHWWAKDKNSPVRPSTGAPMSQMFEFYRGQKFKQWGYTVSTNYFHDSGFREGEVEYRGRVSGTIYIHPLNWKKVKAGIGYNIQGNKSGSFLLWESDSLGYKPQGGINSTMPLFGEYQPNPADSSATMAYSMGPRIYIDPYVKFFDKYNNRHNFKTRMYHTANKQLLNEAQGNSSTIWYGEYQFQRNFTEDISLTAGFMESYNVVTSQLMGNHTANNMAIYGQYEHHIGKFDFTAGLRIEHYKMDTSRVDTEFKIGNGSIPVYPIARLGIHYQPAKYTHLRVSYGQGIRYPSVAERYTSTNVGPLSVFPNPFVRPEKGWAAEIGIKQGVKIGDDWKGLFDLAAFVNVYENMMEFTFGVYDPITFKSLDYTVQADIDRIVELQNDYGYSLSEIIGFQSRNSENARITGIDFSFNSMGNIKGVEILSMIGYTYMNPVTLNDNPTYQATFSDTVSGLLKYRFRHLAKADVEVNYKGYSLGFSLRYNSYMPNIDKVFLESIGGSYVLPGLAAYREKYNKGTFVADVRIGYKFNDHFRIGAVCNNLFNVEYTTRPGDIQAPRNFILQLTYKL
ncbi:MAG: TonB-dependent receptor [Bacteroidota bacterium]